jgi:predicted nucleic acid-binding protein
MPGNIKRKLSMNILLKIDNPNASDRYKYLPGITMKLLSGHLDFDDANQYYIAKKFKAEIITFDRDFKVIRDVKVQILK